MDISIVPVESLDLVLSITNVMGFDTPEADPFTDDWWWANNEGKCADRTFPSSAEKQLSKAINLRSPKVTSGWLGGFFLDEETMYMYPHQYPNKTTGFNNMRDYLFFQIQQERSPTAAAWAEAFCIKVADMNWYYNNYLNLINTQRQIRGKQFSYIRISPDGHLHLEPDGTTQHNHLWHFSEISFGTFHHSPCREICGNPNYPCYVTCLCTPELCPM